MPRLYFAVHEQQHRIVHEQQHSIVHQQKHSIIHQQVKNPLHRWWSGFIWPVMNMIFMALLKMCSISEKMTRN